MELLSPAGGQEAVIAAVQSGADAVYLGAERFNARRGAQNFDADGLAEAVQYCHLRGVKVYLTLNTLLTGRELSQALELAAHAGGLGVDALIVQDVGLIALLRRELPRLPLHGSTQMTIHNLDGVRLCADLGLERVVLSRELSKQQIAYICKNSPIEIEVFVHGALCMCYSGQCFLSSVIGGRSGNRGLCAQPCRLKYSGGYPLSLKDLSLVEHLRDLEDMGVACAKIEGRMRRPEYVAVVTRIYAAALREHRPPTDEEREQLRLAFSRQGFTDGYYEGRTGRAMFGVRQREDPPTELFAQARREYGREHPLVPVSMVASIQAGQPAQLEISDREGHRAVVTGEAPQPASSRVISPEQVTNQISRTGGTPFFVENCLVEVEDGLFLPLSALNALRRAGLEELGRLRISTTPMPPIAPNFSSQSAPTGWETPRRHTPVFTISLRSGTQLSEELLTLRPAVIYLPPAEILNCRALAGQAASAGIEICAALPRILWDDERPALAGQLERLHHLGISSVLAGDWGGIALAGTLGFACRGDFGLGVCNSQALAKLKELGLRSATLSFEQRLERLRDLQKPLNTELLAYGRLPLMIMQNAPGGRKDPRSLTDRTGAEFPLLSAGGSRWELLNAKPLFLADKLESLAGLDLWGLRLAFSNESPADCVRIFRRYLGQGDWQPQDYTRGLYFRTVE